LNLPLTQGWSPLARVTHRKPSFGVIKHILINLKEHRHIIHFLGFLLLNLAAYCLNPAPCFAYASASNRFQQMPTDTVPKKPKSKSSITRYMDILTDKQQRDSLFKVLSRQNAPKPVPDSVLQQRRQDVFMPYRGKIIRDIYYNQLNVFGTQLLDTSFSTSMKLIRFANKLHLNTKEWILRQALFFRENDTVNAYKLVENERYLRSLPYIQDARIYVINSYQHSDSIDIVVLTKDVFEYGIGIGSLSETTLGANVYNTNLFGLGQKVLVGYDYAQNYTPQSRGEATYTKYNAQGSFTNINVGYSALNDQGTADTGVYERAYFVSASRPLYTTWAEFTGGFSLGYNSSVNINSLPDSLYRDYRYNTIDGWAGYNFSSQTKNNGFKSEKPNYAIELKQYNRNFQQKPSQPQWQNDPNYNDNHYTLGQFVLFHQDFYKTNYFYGFGKTEDIPTGYNAIASAGLDDWVGLRRYYTAVQGQKYWLDQKKNLFSGMFGLGSFFHHGVSQDAVIHAQAKFYSNIHQIGQSKLRQFLSLDYLACPNPVLYKPLNINQSNGILGYRNTTLNGYKRLNMSATTTLYSPISIYGFKFNFYGLFQASMLAASQQSLLNSPFYSGVGLGVQIKNENLALNALTIEATYQAQVPGAPSALFIQITSTALLTFNIFALTEPQLLPFQ
jgi:hypothetical protein